mgnify:CR=1 FL=1
MIKFKKQVLLQILLKYVCLYSEDLTDVTESEVNKEREFVWS